MSLEPSTVQSVMMNSSVQLHLSYASQDSVPAERKKIMVILDIGGERFLCDRELLQGFPATRFVICGGLRLNVFWC